MFPFYGWGNRGEEDRGPQRLGWDWARVVWPQPACAPDGLCVPVTSVTSSAAKHRGLTPSPAATPSSVPPSPLSLFWGHS